MLVIGSSTCVEQRSFEELQAGEDTPFLRGREMGVILLMTLIILKLLGSAAELRGYFCRSKVLCT